MKATRRYPHMNFFDHMAFALKLAGVAKDEVKTRVNKAAAILRLEALLERKPAAMSGGQRQRLAIGRAVVRNLSTGQRLQLSVQPEHLHRFDASGDRIGRAGH